MKATIPKPAAALLDFIAHYESRGNYLAYIGHAGSLLALPPTLDGVLTFQRGLVAKGAPSGAVGRYQIIEKTLKLLMAKYRISGSEAFTSDLQDELAFYLLQGRGYDAWANGSTKDDVFANALSQEWASMPYSTGRSFYDGDHINSALVSRKVFLEAIASAKNGTSAVAQKEPSMNKPTTAAAPKVDFISGIINFAENTIAQINSGIKVAVSPNNNAVTVTPGSASVSGVFSSISQAQLAISEIGKVIADAKAGAWSNEPEDVLSFLKTFFGILATFGITVPGLTAIIEMLPDLPAVTASAA